MSTKSLPRENRAHKAGRLEARAGNDGSLGIRGLGAVYNSYSEDFGGWKEVLDPAAFNKTLGDGASKVYATFNHDDNLILGRVSAGNLTLENTDEGLVYDVRLNPKSPTHQHVHAVVEDGTVNGSSFTFRVFPDSVEWEEDSSGTIVRRILSCQLYEIGPVAWPAYPETDSTVRSRALMHLAESRSLPLDEVVKCAQEGHLLDIVRHKTEDSENRGTVSSEAAETQGDHVADRLLVVQRRLRLIELNAPTL